MRNLKIWSLLLPIVLISLEYKKVANAGRNTYIGVEELLGGFVGCLWQNVCQPTELCVDDSLFGKCMDRYELARGSTAILSVWQLQQLEEVLNRHAASGIDWSNLHLQCVLRSILSSSKALEAGIAENQCGLNQPAVEDIESGLITRQENSLLPTEKTQFFRPARTISRKLKRRVFKDSGLPDYYASVDPEFKPEFIDRIVFDTESETRKQNPTSDLREKFNEDLKRIISQLQKQHYARKRLPKESQSSTHRVTLTPSDIRSSTDWAKRLNQKNDKPLKRRYQLRLPDDLQPLPQRTRSWVWTKFHRRSLNTYEAEQFLQELFHRLNLASPIPTFHLDKTGNVLYFQVPATTGTTAEAVAEALKEGKGDFEGFQAEQVGFGRGTPLYPSVEGTIAPKNYTVTLIVCLTILSFVVVLFSAYAIQVCRRKLLDRRIDPNSQKTALLTTQTQTSSSDKPMTKSFSINSPRGLMKKIHSYFERHTNPEKMKAQKMSGQIITQSCRPSIEERMGQPEVGSMDYRYSKDTVLSELSNITEPKRKSTIEHKDSLTSQSSSTYSGSSEPVSCAIDVTTGHLILSYMEAYLREESRLNADWEAVSAYEAEEATPCVDAQRPENLMKNRLIAPLPYEQSRVRLRCTENDYINASLIYDHSPRNPVYIATPTPLLDTLADFWQMIWEQSSVVLVCLERTADLKQPDDDIPDNEATDASIQYWPSEGTHVYGNFEVHLVSEHSSCDKYVVRSFYLKNLQTVETRTVTQFHYLTWNDDRLKRETRAMLDFRRKVNRSFRGMMSPIVVHCQDGSGRTGTYILLDLVLNRIAKGVKEINIAASLEHLRDQRQSMVQRKEQYEFVFTAVAHEVDAMLKMSGHNG